MTTLHPTQESNCDPSSHFRPVVSGDDESRQEGNDEGLSGRKTNDR